MPTKERQHNTVCIFKPPNDHGVHLTLDYEYCESFLFKLVLLIAFGCSKIKL